MRTSPFASPLLPVLILSALVSWPAAAAAQEEGESEAPSASTYIQKVRAGIQQAVARNFEGAIASLREAVQEAPTQPHAYYYAGETHRIQGNLDAALQAFRDGARIAEQAGDDMLQGRCLQAIAETLERKGDALTEAREAWSAYARFADSHRMVASPEIARARIQAIDQVVEQEAAYVSVRERIAERERFNAGQGQPRRGTQ